MKTPPIPPFTIPNLCGAVGDVMRTAWAWGSAAQAEAPIDAHVVAAIQSVAQLLTLALQREPTDAEIQAVVGT